MSTSSSLVLLTLNEGRIDNDLQASTASFENMENVPDGSPGVTGNHTDGRGKGRYRFFTDLIEVPKRGIVPLAFFKECQDITLACIAYRLSYELVGSTGSVYADTATYDHLIPISGSKRRISLA